MAARLFFVVLFFLFFNLSPVSHQVGRYCSSQGSHEETVFLNFLSYSRKLLNPRRELQLVHQKYR